MTTTIVGMDIESLAAAAAELADRLAYMANAVALPGDSSVRWHDHREESLKLIALLNAGIHFAAVPE